MNRRRRTWIIGKSGPLFAKNLADSIRQRYAITIIQMPQDVLVMLKMRESARNSLFYLGELMVTEARVAIHNHVGIGIVQQDDGEQAHQFALDAAIIDAAYMAHLEETHAWEDLLRTEEERILRTQQLELQRINQSTVNFETMDTPHEE
ncbi:MAG: phosphonate C-P lyase system protein PhnG [Treponemataceae bacterium]|nr:phosphonate C-P lyase system protein PhnG [Treponemataceae bacterium]